MKRKPVKKITICPEFGTDVLVKHGKFEFFQCCIEWPSCGFKEKMYDINAAE